MDQRFGLTSAVPEPSVWAMLILGFGLVGAALRRGRPRRAALAR
ncbi:PEPxxWA-CTERM sorting domain-containing protein [Sphingomonas sp. RHCKR7]|nr:PEPxxWA-CTERM sorting domain-containing protein [Sphingomonas folli]